MLVSVYPDGSRANALDLAMPPELAAQTYCEQKSATIGLSIFLIVVPVDDEARALPGWAKDDDGLFLAFRGVQRPCWTIHGIWPETLGPRGT